MAIGLTWVFWAPLWEGGGLIGGDIYPYYFPQKTTLADALKRGELPFWNSLVSLGYPQLAESQTGALYLPMVVLYRLLDVNTAYNAVHLLHYGLAYVFTWLLARRFRVSVAGAHLAALSFVYGWFPPRVCLEWAIIGGVFCPLFLWCVESYLQTARIRWLGIAAVALAVDLTAGHFHLAFITLVIAGLLVLCRLIWATGEVADTVLAARGRVLLRFTVAVALGFLIAAPQLLPSVELKRVSQRDEAKFNPAYGYIPVWYLTQPVFPLLWYGPDMDAEGALFKTSMGEPPVSTNKIEAHLYFGMIPFYLVLSGVLLAKARGTSFDRRMLMWLAIGLLGVTLTTGYPILAMRRIPGFGYFAGPGRYGLMTAVAVALGAGRMLDAWRSAIGRFGGALLVLICLAVTTGELWLVSRWVTNAMMVSQPPVSYRDRSPFAETFRNRPKPARVFAVPPNLPTIAGVNCVPEYLGIGPKQYYDPKLCLPRYDEANETPELRAALIKWLQQAGVTHVLREKPLDEKKWPVWAVMSFFDPFLNGSLARGRDDYFLYELRNSRALAFLEGQPDGLGVTLTRDGASRVKIEVDAPAAGRAVLLDLPYPGWTVTVDGQPATPEVFEEMYRAVQVPAGRHTVEWRFVPTSFYLGLAVAAAAFVALLAWMRFDRTGRVTTVTVGQAPA